MRKLAVVVSHPIQYHAPLFRYLAARMPLVVLYAHNPTAEEVGRQGFGKRFTWDVDLLSGYDHVFLKNVSGHPSLENFSGCDTPGVGREIRRQGATHVLIFGWFLKTYWQAYVHCLRTGTPFAVRGDSQLDARGGRAKSIAKRLAYPLFLRQYVRLFYVGQRNRAYLRHYGVPARKLVFAPHAIDQDFWRAAPEDAAPPAAAGRPLRLLWVGKFIDKKQPADAIDALGRLPADGYHLTMVGTGELLEMAQRRARRLPHVTFAGFKNQKALRTLLHETDALLLTSDAGETWGLVVNEAFAAGRPAVVSDACGCAPDLIEEGVTGYTYPLGDADALAERITRLGHSLRNNPKHFAPGIARKNDTYHYQTNYEAFREFLDTV